jgi:16S rRNA (cytidine1402-2'-O)-methyltransferase
VSIDKGVLYVVATPIGNREDISRRAIEILRSVDLIAAEDTRHSGPLLRQLGIETPLLAFHEHNEQRVLDKLIGRLLAGDSMALISDAGTPLISDPGFPLVRECHRRGLRVSPLPGASALVCALSAGGLPTDRFLFAGFPARNGAARREQLRGLAQEPGTLVFYESSHRVRACLADMAEVFGDARPAVLARELTKLHETIVNADVGALRRLLEADPLQRKGEFVILIAGAPSQQGELSPESVRILRILGEELPLKQAAALAARITGEKKNLLYRLALDWKET